MQLMPGDIRRFGRTRFVLVALACLVAAISGARARAASSPVVTDDDWRDGYTAVRVQVEQPSDITTVVDAIQGAGGRIAVTIPPSTYPGEAVSLGWITPETGTTLLGRHGIRSVLTPQRAWIETAAAEASRNPGLSFWHRVVTGRVPVSPPAEWPSHAGSDVRVPDDGTAPSPGDDGHRPVLNGTSDQMTGTVTCALFMIESNGTLDPDVYTWTPADSTTEVSGMLSAFSWWSSKAPTYGKSVTFTLVIHGPSGSVAKSKYEPILHTSSEVSLWVNDVLSHLGYISGSDRTRATNYNNSLISTYGTNWAFCVFCGYNPLPAADSYTNGTSAWAYLNGPYMQTLFRSYGWAVDQVSAHEMGHIFGACDEYAGGCGSCDVCTKNVLNANCEVCNPETQACMMKANTFRLCPYTPGQIGWEVAAATVVVDTFTVTDPAPADNDGIPEPSESVNISVTLRNIGNAPARAMSATMTSASPYVSIVTGSASYGDVLITATSFTTYRVSIASNAPVGHVANLLLNITGSGYSGVDTVAMIVSPIRVLRITPATGVDTGSVVVRIGGKNFLPGVSFRLEKNGYPSINATAVTLVNADSITGTLNLVGAQLFSWDLVVQNSNGQTGRLVNGFYINPAGPTIIAVNPPSSSPGLGTIAFGIKGRNFNIPTSVYIEQGATKRFANSIVAVSPDSISCQLNVSGLPTGLYDVVEQNFDTQIGRLTAGFQLFPTPDLQSIAPEVVATGAPVTITLNGANFASGASAWLWRSGKPTIFATSVLFDNAGQLRATFNLAGASVGSRNVGVQNPGGGKDSVANILQIVTPPTAHVVHPNGGGPRLIPGSSTTVGWTAQSLGNGLDHIQVLLSLDGGLTYGEVIGTAGPDDTSLVWIVPNVNTDSAKVRVVAYDVDNITGSDDSDAIFGIGTVVGVSAAIPRAFALGPVVPEPNGRGVSLRLDLPREARVDAEVFDLRGGLVQRIEAAVHPAGTHTLRWGGTDRSNRPAAAGIYYLRVRASDWTARHRILLVP